MIFERVVLEALTEPKTNGVKVRSYVRKKASNPLRERVHAALRGVPTEPGSTACAGSAS